MAKKNEDLSTTTVSNAVSEKLGKMVEQWKKEAGGSSLLDSQLDTLRKQVESEDTPAGIKPSLRDAIGSLEQAQQQAIKPQLQTIAKGVVHALQAMGVPVAVQGQTTAAASPRAARTKASGGEVAKFITSYLAEHGESKAGDIKLAGEKEGLNVLTNGEKLGPMAAAGQIQRVSRGVFASLDYRDGQGQLSE